MLQKNAGLKSSFIPSDAGASLVSAFSSKGTIAVTGLPANVDLQGKFGNLDVNESVTVDIELESFGVPGYDFEKRLKVRPKLPDTLPYEFFTVPVVYDETTHPSGVNGNLVLVEDGSDTPGAPGTVGSVNDACQPLTNAAAVNGNIALINARYQSISLVGLPTPPWAACSFNDQINNAFDAGAIGIILAAHHDIYYVPLSPPASVQPGPVPVAAIGLLDYNLLVDALSSSATVNVSLEKDYPTQWWPTLDLLDARVTLDNDHYDIAELDKSNNYVMAAFACSFDKDKDLAPDSVERCPEDVNKILPGQCGCGNPDTDSDGDGFAVCNDSCPKDSDKITPGACGCGVADKDSDGDKTLDCNEQCPTDPAKTSPGVCGCSVADVDANGNGIMDCLYQADLMELITAQQAYVKKLKATKSGGSKKKRKAQKKLKKKIKALSAKIRELLASISANVLVLTDASKDVGAEWAKTNKKLKKATRTNNSKFRKFKKRAKKALKKLLKLLGG